MQDGVDPTHMYQYDRKGWHIYASEVTPDRIENMRSLGAKFFIGERLGFSADTYEKLIRKYKLLCEDKGFCIIELR